MAAKLGSVSSLLMKRIQMVDLEGQTARIRPQLDEAIARVLDSSKYIGGEEVSLFAKELSEELDDAFVIPCANGTDALQIALMSLGIGPGDEVIVPTFTFISPVEVIALLGAKPILVDVYPDSFNIDCESVEGAITDRTKAIVAVHLFGQCADMGKLMSIAEKHNLPIVEDTAQSLTSIYCDEHGLSGKAGTIGAIGTTSFFPSKNLGCFGDGGAIITRSEELASECRTITNHGSKVRYNHSSVGINSRLDALQATILRVKLRELEDYNSKRREAALRYDNLLEGFDGVEIPHRNKRSSHVFHQYTVKLQGANNAQIQNELATEDIPVAIYYPTPIHLQPAYLSLGYSEGNFQVSEKLSKIVLSLPMHTELSAAQQEHIVDRLKAAITKWT